MQFHSRNLPQDVVNVINLNLAALELYVQHRLQEQIMQQPVFLMVEQQKKRRPFKKGKYYEPPMRRRISAEEDHQKRKVSGNMQWYPFPPF